MSPSNLQARRATVDDLADLRRLWHQAGLPIGELEKQLTDFQVVETPEGQVLGTLALRVHDHQGWLHSAACRESEHADEWCERLWNRVRAVARNHGLYRLWTQETAPFWQSLGFVEAPPDLLQKLPANFGASGVPWLVLKLRDEAATNISWEQEFEAFTLAQRESSARLTRQTKLIKNFAYLILFAALVMGALIMAFAVLPRASWSRWFNPTARSRPPAVTTNAVPLKP